MTEAFRTFAIDTPQVARTLRARLAERVGDYAVQLSGGYAQDFADYKQRVGVIDGLKMAIEICDEMIKEEHQ